MEPIDRVAIMGPLTSSEGQTAIKAMTGAEAYNHFLTLVCSAPAVDPIRAAGGCRCGECRHHGAADGPMRQCDITDDNDFCSYGEPMEAQNDG